MRIQSRRNGESRIRSLDNFSAATEFGYQEGDERGSADLKVS